MGVTWDNSTFGEPQSMPSGQYMIALRRLTSPLPPLRAQMRRSSKIRSRTIGKSCKPPVHPRSSLRARAKKRRRSVRSSQENSHFVRLIQIVFLNTTVFDGKMECSRWAAGNVSILPIAGRQRFGIAGSLGSRCVRLAAGSIANSSSIFPLQFRTGGIRPLAPQAVQACLSAIALPDTIGQA